MTGCRKKDKETSAMLKFCGTLFREAGHQGVYSFQSNYNLTDEWLQHYDLITAAQEILSIPSNDLDGHR